MPRLPWGEPVCQAQQLLSLMLRVLRQCQVQRFLAGFSDFLSQMVNMEVILVKCTLKTPTDMEHHGTFSLNLSWAMFSMFNCGMGHQLQIEMDLFLFFFLYGATLSPLLFNRARTDP